MKPRKHHMWMAKGRADLATAWGITRTMREMRERLDRDRHNYTIVRVLVMEEDECDRHDLERALIGDKHAHTETHTAGTTVGKAAAGTDH